MTLIEPLEARSQVEEGPIEAQSRIDTSTGRGNRDAEAEAEVQALEARLSSGSKTGNRARDADEELIKRAIGFPAGGSTGIRRDAQGLKFSSPGGHRRDADAEAIERSSGLRKVARTPIASLSRTRPWSTVVALSNGPARAMLRHQTTWLRVKRGYRGLLSVARWCHGSPSAMLRQSSLTALAAIDEKPSPSSDLST